MLRDFTLSGAPRYGLVRLLRREDILGLPDGSIGTLTSASQLCPAVFHFKIDSAVNASWLRFHLEPGKPRVAMVLYDVDVRPVVATSLTEPIRDLDVALSPGSLAITPSAFLLLSKEAYLVEENPCWLIP